MGAAVSTNHIASPKIYIEEYSTAPKQSKDSVTVSIHESEDTRLFVTKDPQVHKEVIRILSCEGNEIYSKLFYQLDSMQRRTFNIIHCVTKRSQISIGCTDDGEEQFHTNTCNGLSKKLSFIFDDIKTIRSVPEYKTTSIQYCLAPLIDPTHLKLLITIETNSLLAEEDPLIAQKKRYLSEKRLILQWYESISKAQDRLLTILMDEWDCVKHVEQCTNHVVLSF